MRLSIWRVWWRRFVTGFLAWTGIADIQNDLIEVRDVLDESSRELRKEMLRIAVEMRQLQNRINRIEATILSRVTKQIAEKHATVRRRRRTKNELE